MSTLETQVGGNHYKKFKIQPIEFIVANDIPYRPANVIKYVCRYKDKNGLEDLKKARHYLDMLIEEEEAKKSAHSVANTKTFNQVRTAEEAMVFFGIEESKVL